MFLLIWRVWFLWFKITLGNCLKEVRMLILAGIIRKVVSDEDFVSLTGPFQKEEFHEALFSMHLDKTPGSDGLNSAFLQKYWHILSDEIFKASTTWLQRGNFPPSLTLTNIVLIPKITSLDQKF